MKNFMEMVLTEKLYVGMFNSAAFWLVALILMTISYFALDKVILRRIHLTDELSKGNIAVAIVIAAFMGAIGLVIFGITN